MNKLLVIFPGIGYTCDMPLLRCIEDKYRARGYEIVKIKYREFKSEPSITEKYKEIKSYIMNEFEDIDFTEYSEVVFAEKSIGTAVGMFVQESLSIEAEHICLTPINETLPFITKERNIRIVVSGTKDKYIDYRMVEERCRKNNQPCLIIPEAGHRLEIADDEDKNTNLLRSIIERC